MPGPRSLVPSELNRLLTVYLNCDLRFEEAAEALNLTLLDFIAQLQHPDVERAIAIIAEAKARRAEHLTLCAHDTAVAALVRLIDSGKATGPVRAAASSLLRRIRESSCAAGAKRPPRRGEGLDEIRAPVPITDTLPLPDRGVGEGRGEGHQVRASSTSDRAADSDAASTEKSAPPPRRDAPTVDGCPGQRSDPGGAKSAGNPRPPDAVGAVAELCSATNKPPHPITAQHSGPPP